VNRESFLIAGCRRRKLAHQVPLLRRFGSAVRFTKFREWATWMATARPLSRGAHDSKHSTAEPQSRFSSGTQRRELTGCRKLAQRAAAPKVILPGITFGITCGRRSPLAERLNCGKTRGKRTSGGETRDRLDTSYRVRKFVITIGDRHSGGTDILVGAAPRVVWMRVGCHWRLVRQCRARGVRGERREERGEQSTEGGRRHRAFRTCCRSMFPPPASQPRTSSVSRMRDVSTCDHEHRAGCRAHGGVAILTGAICVE